MDEQTAKVTSLEELRAYSQGALVALPDFAEGQPFVARLRRPSMLQLAKVGKIPNQLLQTANGLFADSKLDDGRKDMLSQMLDLCTILAEASFVSPKYSEIVAAGIELTDEQLMFVFNYGQTGVRALSGFRGQQISAQGVEPVNPVQPETVGDNGN